MGIHILIVVDTCYAGIHHSKYLKPIHYDTIEDGQNKKSHLLFSKSYQSLEKRKWAPVDAPKSVPNQLPFYLLLQTGLQVYIGILFNSKT